MRCPLFHLALIPSLLILTLPADGATQTAPSATPSRISIPADGGEVEITLASKDVEQFDGVTILDARGRRARGLVGSLGRAARGRRILRIESRGATAGRYAVELAAARATVRLQLDVSVEAPPPPTLTVFEVDGGGTTVYPGQTLLLSYGLSASPSSPITLEVTGSDPTATPDLPQTLTLTSSSGTVPITIGDFDLPGAFHLTATIAGVQRELPLERAFPYLEGIEILDAPGGSLVTTAVGDSEVVCAPIVTLTEASSADVELVVGLSAVAGGSGRMQGQTSVQIPAGATEARGSEPCPVPAFLSPSVNVAYHASYRELSRTAILASTPPAPPITGALSGMNDLWPGDSLDVRFSFGGGDALTREIELQYSDASLLVNAPSTLTWAPGMDSRFLFEIAPYDFNPPPLEITMTGGGATISLVRDIVGMPTLESASVTLGHGGPSSGEGPQQLVCGVTLSVYSSPRRTFYDTARFESSRPDLLAFYGTGGASPAGSIDALVAVRPSDGTTSASGTQCALLGAVDEETPVEVTVTYRGQSVVTTFTVLPSWGPDAL